MNTTSETAAAFDVTALTKALTEASTFIAKILAEEGLNLQEEIRWQPVPTTSPGHAEQILLMQRFQAVQRELHKFPELKAWAK